MTKLLSFIAAASIAVAAQAQNSLNLGGDISMLPRYESVSTPYYDTQNNKIDVIQYLQKDCKMNSMRVRLFVNPNSSEANDGVVQDLEYVKKLGKRIKDAGLDFMLDFHYSDTWADPAKQSIPSAWMGDTSNGALQNTIYAYTKQCLEALSSSGAKPDFVQIGNEVSYGMLWRSNGDRCYSNSTVSTWRRFTDLLSSAAKAVRETTPDAKIIIHIERSGDADACVRFFNTMKSNKVDYDVIGLSYYPFWHNGLSSLGSTLNKLEQNFPDKPVQIVETAYYYQYFPANDASFTNTTSVWKATPAGQQAFVEDLCAELAKHDNVTGLYYWFPEENGSGGAKWEASKVVLNSWLNRGLWNNDTHKANPALLKLQNFLQAKEAASIGGTSQTKASSSYIYNIAGQRVDDTSRPGVYIMDGKKILKR